jgi:two-component system phosphate regulon response regulator PhoB
MNLKRVLLAEDDRDIQVVARMALKMGGVEEVFLASDGQECLSLAQKARPDLILLDVMMPRLDGYATCEALKQDPAANHIPVIFLTAKAQNADVQRGLAVGGIGYLTKPFDPTTLCQCIVSIMDGR